MPDAAHQVASAREAQLLLLLTRAHPENVDGGSVARAVGSGVDWKRLVRLALGHGVQSMAAASIDALGIRGIPEDAAAELAAGSIENRVRSLFLTRTLVDLLEAAESAGIPVAAFKGPALAQAVYGDVGLRSFGDLDLIVPRSRAIDARRLMAGLGYLPPMPLDERQESALLGLHHCFTGIDARGVSVEIHWRFAQSYWRFGLDSDEVWERLEPLELGGRHILTLAPPDLLLVLSVHGATHAWGRLLWISDIAELVRSGSGLDWPQVLRSARLAHCERAVLLACLLAAEMLDAPVPATVLEKARSNRAVVALGNRVRRRYEGTSPEPGAWAMARFHAGVIDSLGDRLRLALGQGLRPTPAEWSCFRLPENLRFLYYPLRPLRLLGCYTFRRRQESARRG